MRSGYIAHYDEINHTELLLDIWGTALFSQGKFPDIAALTGGTVVEGCWMKRYSTAVKVLQGIQAEILIEDDDI